MPVSAGPLERYDRAAARSSAVVIGEYSTSFGLAVRLLPSRTRGHIRNVYALVRLADEIVDNDTTDALTRRLHAIASRMACHGSVRSGRRLRAEEMNALLRQMEATPGSGTCNHGRPTYIELKLHDIERLFGRR